MDHFNFYFLLFRPHATSTSPDSLCLELLLLLWVDHKKKLAPAHGEWLPHSLFQEKSTIIDTVDYQKWKYGQRGRQRVDFGRETQAPVHAVELSLLWWIKQIDGLHCHNYCFFSLCCFPLKGYLRMFQIQDYNHNFLHLHSNYLSPNMWNQRKTVSDPQCQQGVSSSLSMWFSMVFEIHLPK